MKLAVPTSNLSTLESATALDVKYESTNDREGEYTVLVDGVTVSTGKGSKGRIDALNAISERLAYKNRSTERAKVLEGITERCTYEAVLTVSRYDTHDSPPEYEATVDGVTHYLGDDVELMLIRVTQLGEEPTAGPQVPGF